MTLHRKKIFTLILFLLSISITLCIGELVARKILKKGLDTWDERNLMYRHDPALGWVPLADRDFRVMGDHIRHNRRGFRDVEHIKDGRPGILFLGDSFVWGYGVGQEERFTDRLRLKLPDAAIYNLGVSGYGTDQEYLLLQQNFDYYQPRIVFLEFTTDNDEDDNSTDMRYGTYFKPYFKPDGDKLQLCGVPVPLSVNYFIAGRSLLSRSYLARLAVKAYLSHVYPPPASFANPTSTIIKNMHAFVSGRGATLLVGLQQPHPELEKFLRNEGIPFVQLATPLTFSDEGRHWTKDGHIFVSEKIYDFISKGNFLKGKSIP